MLRKLLSICLLVRTCQFVLAGKAFDDALANEKASDAEQGKAS